jgi:DNA polymerase-3 subunit alpha
MDRVATANKKKDQAQISFFGTLLDEDEGLEIEYPNMPEFSSKEKLTLEKTVLGIYLSGHPLSDYKATFDKFSFTTEALQYYDEDEDGNKILTYNYFGVKPTDINFGDFNNLVNRAAQYANRK